MRPSSFMNLESISITVDAENMAQYTKGNNAAAL
jgi:putative lipoic acid-binding regulatory protein